eukprot:Skav221897  [mRNA]  locus=scaffold1395:768355:772908:+ [translate_table: standard]
MGSKLLLEPNFQDRLDSVITVRFRIIARSFGFTMCQTSLHGQRFFTDLPLSEKHREFTVFGGLLTREQGHVWIREDGDTRVFPIPDLHMEGLFKIVECCAGIAAVDRGYIAAGAQVVCHVESNLHFANWLKEKKHVGVVHGNIANPATVQAMTEHVDGAHVMSGGFSCQPFSYLGDRRQEKDPRSESLPGILQAAYLLGSCALLLECTKEAMDSQWVQACLAEFQAATNFTCQQNLLHLQDVWPARRTRWWAVVAHESLGHTGIPSLPGHRFQPTVLHLMPRTLALDEDEMVQLQLDDYELEQFQSAKGGLNAAILNPFKTMPTATHSFGSQCGPCACGCRADGFSKQRLQERGLYGILIEDKATERLRHPHPVEIALCNGLLPSHVSQKTVLKLLLAGTGQMASPLQGAWVLSDLHWQAAKQGAIPEPRHPRLIMLDICHALIVERNRWWPDLPNTHPMTLFLQEIVALVSPKVFAPPQSYDDEPTTQEWITACETAEANMHAPSKIAALEDHKEPAENIEVKPRPKPSSAPGLSRTKQSITDEDRVAKLEQATPTEVSAMTPAEKFVHPVHDQVANMEPQFSTGAVPGFAARPAEPPAKKPSVEETKEVLPTHVAKEDTTESQHVHIVRHHTEVQSISCMFPVTVGQLQRAEEALTKQAVTQVTTLMGEQLDRNHVMQPGQFIMTDGDVASQCPLHTDPTPSIPTIQHITRASALWNQQGWVAVDEMQYYMKAICHDHPPSNNGVFVFTDNTQIDADFVQMILTVIHSVRDHQHAPWAMVMVLTRNHWVPIFMKVTFTPDAYHADLVTTPEYADHFTTIVQSHVGSTELSFQSRPAMHVFPADCGFQCLPWMLGALHEYEPTPMSVEQAAQWRALFHRDLVNKSNDQVMLQEPLLLGGAKSTKDQLCTLVVQHGVASSRGQECADQILQALGTSTVAQILQSPRPWQDLKARTSLHQPPIRIVLADELQQQIAQRKTSGQPVGRKQNKVKQSSASKQPMKIPPEQIIIPHAVFKQDDGQEVGQVSFAQLGPRCRGVLVASVEEALPYISHHQQVSQEGIIMLIPDPNDGRLPEPRQCMRVPAQCKTTGEPMLVTMIAYQLGAKQIVRNMPAQCPAVPQVENQVLRIVVFQDQWPDQWTDFIRGPVKAILAHEAFTGISHDDLLDVWDRQFLGPKLNRAAPKDAVSFAVNVRMTLGAASKVHPASGEAGLYAEPRAQDGRAPDAAFQVIWLSRKNYAESRVVQKTVPMETYLVRHLERYGLRVAHKHAEQAHQAIKPEVPWIPGLNLLKFRVGPMPYGASRANLLEVCKLWGWAARPISPISQSNDRTGTIWLFQAKDVPPAWVYQMQHGEILINQQPEATSHDPKLPTVLASQRTWQSLKQPKEGATKDDPWLHEDPWQTKQRKEVSVGQMQALETSLEKRLMEKLKSDRSEDAEMQPAMDSRVTHLEQQLEAVTATMNQFQQSQTAHNQTMQQQIVQIDAKVDSTVSSMSTLLDTKMDDHMRKIEQLLRKRQGE